MVGDRPEIQRDPVSLKQTTEKEREREEEEGVINEKKMGRQKGRGRKGKEVVYIDLFFKNAFYIPTTAPLHSPL